MLTMKMKNTNRPRRIRVGQFGFNLIELMVTLVIIALLTMFAYPSFMQSVRRGKRADAHTALTRVATNLERFFSTNGTYTTDESVLGLTMDGDSALSDQGHYVISVAAGASGIGSSYVVSATAKEGDMQAKDTGCTTFSLSSLGVRTPDPVDSKCW
jgi:type IV pilus assembly protein PilE